MMFHCIIHTSTGYFQANLICMYVYIYAYVYSTEKRAEEGVIEPNAMNQREGGSNVF